MHGAALARMARGYEADSDRRRDLLQEMHLALWRSFTAFDGRCSLRTWVYRVAHNVAASYVIRQHRQQSRMVSLEDLENAPASPDDRLWQHHALERLLDLVQRLDPIDRQVILSYLEGMDAASIAEITGISPGYVATKVHRIKKILATQFHAGGRHAE